MDPERVILLKAMVRKTYRVGWPSFSAEFGLGVAAAVSRRAQG